MKCEVCGSEIKLRATPLGEQEVCQQWCSLGLTQQREAQERHEKNVEAQRDAYAKARAERLALRKARRGY